MKFKKILATLIISSILGTTSTPIVTLSTNNKEGIKSETIIEKGENNKTNSVSQYGFLSYLYSDDNFTNLNSIKLNVNNDKLIDNDQIKSARFIGHIKPAESKKYQFSTSNNMNCILKLDGEVLLSETENKSVDLEKDKLYSIELEMSGDITDFELFYVNEDNKKEKISNNSIIFPTLNAEYETMLMESDSNKNSLRDSDNDGIPDDWEINGYTYKNNELIKWTTDLQTSNYKKYISNPNRKRTANDPYTDMQKVIGQMPVATKFEARDPMIAAAPVISVGMEKLLISKNQNVTEGSSNTKAVSAGSSTSNSHTAGFQIGAGYVNGGFSFGMSGNYSYTNSTTTTLENTSSNSWSNELGINTAESAYLNANIRYHNTGTAPIYEVKPTTNFVLANSGASIATIKSGPNQIGNSLTPDKSYPRQGLAPISLDVANEVGTSKIAIDINTLNDLQYGRNKINLETSQFNGQYGILTDGDLVTDSTKTWAPIISEIEESSANIILETPTSMKERFIATGNKQDLNDNTPVLSIKEALKKAFNIEEINGLLYYTDENSGKKITITEKSINVIFDKSTNDIVNNQLTNSNKNLFDIPLERGMKLTIVLPEVYDDFSDIKSWNWDYLIPQNSTGILHPNSKATNVRDFILKPNTDYLFKSYVQGALNSAKAILKVTIKDNVSGKILLDKTYDGIKGTDYNLLTIPFSTGTNKNISITLENKGNMDATIDDLSIIRFKKINEEENVIPTITGEWGIASKLNHNKLVSKYANAPNVMINYRNDNNHDQRWIFEYVKGRNAYKIITKYDNKALAWNTTNGTNVFVWKYDSNSDEHHWILEDVGDGYYIFKNYKNPNMVLDLYGGQTSDGTNIQVHERHNGDNQKWKLVK